MTMPPEETASSSSSAPRSTWPGAGGPSASSLGRMWNPELIVVAAAALLVAVIALIVDDVQGNDVVSAIVFLTAAYVISRGIAKASRVYEP